MSAFQVAIALYLNSETHIIKCASSLAPLIQINTETPQAGIAYALALLIPMPGQEIVLANPVAPNSISMPITQPIDASPNATLFLITSLTL